jgi:hypothetical protein
MSLSVCVLLRRPADRLRIGSIFQPAIRVGDLLAMQDFRQVSGSAIRIGGLCQIFTTEAQRDNLRQGEFNTTNGFLENNRKRI